VIDATILAPSDPLELTLDRSRAILNASRTESAKILGQARKRASRYREKSTERGYRAGFERGEKESSQRCGEVVQSLRALYSTTVDKAQEDVLLVAHRIIEELIDERLRESPELLTSWITRAMAHVRQDIEMTLRYHPRYQENLKDVTACLPRRLTTSMDPTLGEADFAIDTNVGSISFSWRELLRTLNPSGLGERRA
jgi:flagellar biosynthesis/type III secretory pathway protein FliH